jgi:hypothetical protein
MTRQQIRPIGTSDEENKWTPTAKTRWSQSCGEKTATMVHIFNGVNSNVNNQTFHIQFAITICMIIWHCVGKRNRQKQIKERSHNDRRFLKMASTRSYIRMPIFTTPIIDVHIIRTSNDSHQALRCEKSIGSINLLSFMFLLCILLEPFISIFIIYHTFIFFLQFKAGKCTHYNLIINILTLFIKNKLLVSSTCVCAHVCVCVCVYVCVWAASKVPLNFSRSCFVLSILLYAVYNSLWLAPWAFNGYTHFISKFF